jgi:hypothetical protein
MMADESEEQGKCWRRNKHALMANFMKFSPHTQVSLILEKDEPEEKRMPLHSSD